MKKLILSSLLVSAFIFVTYAQEKQDDGTYKPTSGYTAEVNLVPANTSMPVSIDMLKLRMFISENMAVRLGFNFGMHNENFKDGADALSTEYHYSYTKYGLAPGVEMHLGDLPKLSPYFGAEVGFFMKTAKSEIKNYHTQTGGTATIETTGAWFDESDLSNFGYNQIGLNLFLGTDYYFSKHIFCGVEIGFGLTNTTYSEVKLTSTDTNVYPALTIPKAKSMDVGVNFNPAFRLGWAF